VVYTGKFVDFLLGAVHLFYANLFGDGSHRDTIKRLGIDTPCRGLEIDFRGALWPDDEFVMAVGVAAIRHSSFDLRIHALQEGGREIFHGRFSSICIPATGERRSTAIPKEFREALAPHIITS
jgi:acyl-CoA thioesterase FadM